MGKRHGGDITPKDGADAASAPPGEALLQEQPPPPPVDNGGVALQVGDHWSSPLSAEEVDRVVRSRPPTVAPLPPAAPDPVALTLTPGQVAHLTWTTEEGDVLVEGMVTEHSIIRGGWTPDDFALQLVKLLPEPRHQEAFQALMVDRQAGAAALLLGLLNMYASDGHLSAARLDVFVEESRQVIGAMSAAQTSMEYTCEACQRAFVGKRYGQRFCCNACGRRAHGDATFFAHMDDCPTGLGGVRVSA